MTKLSEVIHLYLYCNVQHVPDDGTTAILMGVEQGRVHLLNNTHNQYGMATYDDVKPILRSLYSMTEEEAKIIEASKAFQRPSPVHHLGMMVWTAESYRLALSMDFDLFRLIENGFAIDAATLNQKQ